ncbi:MAG: hypothetical protein DI537_27805 [Stutzerimonas stutzeri]|nr:MAG: hypothetical protein DI537_27805 [Stutzerimonas stutzeri]
MQTADPPIVATWIKGWTLARETTPPTPYRGGFRVDVGWPEQKARYVFPAIMPPWSISLKGDGDGWRRLTIDRSPYRAG